jgi:uncharacterized protein YecE (DUF72 family)
MALRSIRIGVAGWNFPDWYGTVYPKRPRGGFHPLEFLAQRVDAVEIVSSFYESPRPELSRLWMRKVERNDRFMFTARLGREFTHERRLDAEPVREFIRGMEPLAAGGKLGAVLMQFPFSFRFTEENKQMLIRLRRLFHMFPLVAEMRHQSWTSPEGLGTLIDYHVGYANLDQPERQGAAGPASHLTSGTGYVKFHGRRCGAAHEMFDDRGERRTGNDYLYGIEEMEAWRGRIEHIGRFAETGYVIFNNDGGGKAVINSLQMQGMMGTAEKAAAGGQGASRGQPELFRRTAA